jgi:phosphotransacetylase
VNFTDIEGKLKSQKVPMVISLPEDDESILAAYEAYQLGYVECLFVGNPAVISQKIDRLGCAFSPEIISVSSEEEAGSKSVELVRSGRAKVLMKGNISTPKLLKAVLNSETGIKKGKLLSHVLIFEWEGTLRFLTDGGMVPHPTLEEKQEIISNAVALAHRLGCETPRTAVLSAVESVNFKMSSTTDAAILAKMGDRRQLGKCLVDGPLALDNAIALESAHHKGLFNEVVGKADILVCPDIDTGNVLGKTLLYFTQVPAGGLILGASCPIVLLSRADTKEVRLNSIRLALAAGA